jgi:hypothetical protein
MSDGQLLFIVLVAFTLYECLRWVPIRAWVFQALGGEQWRGAQPWETFRTRGGAVAMLMPVPPLEPHVVTAAWPCAPHEAGLCVWHDESGATQHVPWETVKPIAVGAVLHLTPEHRVRCIHAASAASWAAMVSEWMKQSQEQRAKSFMTRAAKMLDVQALTEAATALAKGTRWLRRIGGAIFFWCLLFLPAIYWRFSETWPSYAALGVLLVLMLVQAVLLARVARREPRLREGFVQHLLSVALFPPASMRAADWVCASRSPEAHPLAALKAWSKPEKLEAVAAKLWREARWPMGNFSERPWHGPEVDALEAFYKAHGLKPESYETSPVLPEGCTRWCPRCRTPYQDSAADCADCGGMELMSAS